METTSIPTAPRPSGFDRKQPRGETSPSLDQELVRALGAHSAKTQPPARPETTSKMMRSSSYSAAIGAWIRRSTRSFVGVLGAHSTSTHRPARPGIGWMQSLGSGWGARPGIGWLREGGAHGGVHKLLLCMGISAREMFPIAKENMFLILLSPDLYRYIGKRKHPFFSYGEQFVGTYLDTYQQLRYFTARPTLTQPSNCSSWSGLWSNNPGWALKGPRRPPDGSWKPPGLQSPGERFGLLDVPAGFPGRRLRPRYGRRVFPGSLHEVRQWH